MKQALKANHFLFTWGKMVKLSKNQAQNSLQMRLTRKIEDNRLFCDKFETRATCTKA